MELNGGKEDEFESAGSEAPVEHAYGEDSKQTTQCLLHQLMSPLCGKLFQRFITYFGFYSNMTACWSMCWGPDYLSSFMVGQPPISQYFTSGTVRSVPHLELLALKFVSFKCPTFHTNP